MIPVSDLATGIAQALRLQAAYEKDRAARIAEVGRVGTSSEQREAADKE